MDGEQLNLFSALFPTSNNGMLCRDMEEAQQNDVGVFVENTVMFQGGSFAEGQRVVITLALKTPFVYYAFDADVQMEGHFSPCSDYSDKFKITDCKTDVIRTIRGHLEQFCSNIPVKHQTIEKALQKMENFI